MGDVVNLNRARKAKTRAKAAVTAAENRIRFGRTKEEKRADADEAARRARTLDGAERSGGGAAADDEA